MPPRRSAEGGETRRRKAAAPKPGVGPGPSVATLNRRLSKLEKEDLRKASAWLVSQKWAPPRELTDEETKRARQMFFEMDQDGSGSVDAEELGRMMVKLGQNPTEQELQELIASVDEGDMDGKLQMREFFKLFALGLDTQGEAKQSDVSDAFMSLGGDPRNGESRVDVNAVQSKLLEDFDLDVNLGNIFGLAGGEVSKEDMKTLCLKTPRAKPNGAN